MSSLLKFFQSKADAFDAGAIAEACADRTTPTLIFMGDRVLPVGSNSDMVAYATRYRSNLLRMGYHRTEATIIEDEAVSQNGRRARFLWHLKDRDGADVDLIDATYHCSRSSDGWRIELIDIAEPVNAKAVSGLPLR